MTPAAAITPTIRGYSFAGSMCTSTSATRESLSCIALFTRCPIIRTLPALAANQRYRNANKRGSRRKCVAAVMPGIGLHGRALHVAADPVDITEQKFLYHDYHYQYPERVRRRTMVRQKNFT